MKRGSLYLCVVSAVLLIATTITELALAQAKQPQQEQAYRVASIKVKSGMGMEWANYLKTELIPAMKKNGVTQLETWATAFGDPDQFVMLIPIKNMAELDGPGPLATVGQDGRDALMAKLQRIVDSARFSIIAAQSNLTIPVKTGYVPKLGVLVTNTVAIGREEEFNKTSKIVMTAAGKANAKGFLSSRLVLGGNAGDHYAVILFDAYADMEKFVPAFVQAINEAKLAPQPGMVTQRQYEVLRYVPDLSVQPVAP